MLLVLGTAFFAFFCSETGTPEIPEPIVPVAGLNFETTSYEPSNPEMQGASGWKGKSVLLEYFVGSECPPCLATSLAVDGLLQTFDQKYLSVLEYHVQIPAPDPMENRYSHLRRFDYDVFRAPMTLFDGKELFRGGGSESAAPKLYEMYREHIQTLLDEEPEILLKAVSILENDSLLEVRIEAEGGGKDLSIMIALVENDVEYLGKNRIPLHKMVVRDLQQVTIDENGTARHTFNINQVEAIGKKWLRGIEENYSPFKFKEKKYLINKNNLKVVVFAQDTLSKKIYNSFVSDIK